MSTLTLLERGVGYYGSDYYGAGTWIYKNNLKAPIGYIEAIDNSVAVSGVKYELGGASADDSLNWLATGLPLTPMRGMTAFPREVMEFTVDGEVRVYYASKPVTQLELAEDNPMSLITDENLEIIHF